MKQPKPQDYLSFRLKEDFIKQYKRKQVPWGFPIGGGNYLGEITYLTKYSRRKPNGSKEKWWETCRRVIEGMYSIQQDWCTQNVLPWNERKARNSAEEAYDRLFHGKWTPPGRGLWMMGTYMVNGLNNSAPLQNCAFISTEMMNSRNVEDTVLPFTRLMEMSMLGVGVGFNTKGAGKIQVHQPTDEVVEYRIPDTREGWCESTGLLLESYFFASRPTYQFIYDDIRAAGEPIKTFGGTAAGPGPLMDLHEMIRNIFDGREGQLVSSMDILDLENLIGKCVVAGNVRRSAEIAIGDADDKAFLDAKNWETNPERMGDNGWGHVSNNSVYAEVGGNYDHLIENIGMNGEPGFLFLDLCRKYGRLVDPVNNKDYRAAGTNPCGEQTLESFECCTLVETFPARHESLEDYKRTQKFAYLYAKSVTLLPTHWPETNAIMQRNRRIGCSVSGVAQFAEERGWTELRTWLNQGYDNIQRLDEMYSDWLGCRVSIKTTSVKPSGTVSLLFGVTPGAHWPTASVYIRRMRLAVTDPFIPVFQAAGYIVEPDVMDPKHSVVVEMPTRGPDVRTEREVTMWEKASLAVLLQRWWADNQVSVTITFQEDEREQIGSLLRSVDGQLKSISLLPLLDGGAYKQMPYESITLDEYDELTANLEKLDLAALYAGAANDAEGEKFCTTDVCEIPLAK